MNDIVATNTGTFKKAHCKQRKRRQPKKFNEQNNGVACTRIIYICTFLCCRLQNNNEKQPSSPKFFYLEFQECFLNTCSCFQPHKSLNSLPKELRLSVKWYLFPKFPEKRTTSQGRPKFSKTISGNFQFHLILLMEFPGFSVEWFAFRKVNTFQIFWKLSQEISVPFVLVPKFPDFLVEWKAPLVTRMSFAPRFLLFQTFTRYF